MSPHPVCVIDSDCVGESHMISLLLIYRLLFALKKRMNIKQLEATVDELVVACMGISVTQKVSWNTITYIKLCSWTAELEVKKRKNWALPMLQVAFDTNKPSLWFFSIFATKWKCWSELESFYWCFACYIPIYLINSRFTCSTLHRSVEVSPDYILIERIFWYHH